jgi:hypothetical protein
MMPIYTALIAAVCFAVATNAAHAGERQPGPADPTAAVPATRYQGTLPYRPATPAPGSADRNWKAANQTVAGYDSMRLTMPGMQPPAQEPSPDSPPQGTQQHAPAAATPQHVHHHGGHE